MSQNIHDRKRPRSENDLYATPMPLVDFIVDKVSKRFTGSPRNILDPGAGDGRFANSCRRAWPKARIDAVDIVPAATNIQQGDYLNGWRGRAQYGLVIGNPPFVHTDAFIRRSLKLVARNGLIVFIAHIGVMGGQRRITWLWGKHRPETVAVLKHRPRYAWGMPDMADSVVLMIRGRPSLSTTLEHWDNKEAVR